MNEQDIIDSQRDLTLEDVKDQFKLQSYHVDRLPSFVSDTDAVVDTIRKCMNLTSDLIGDLEERGHSDLTASLEAGLKETIDLEHAIKTQKDLFLQLQANVRQGVDIGNGLDHYNEAWGKEKQRYDGLADKDKYHRHEKYNEFKQLVWNVKHPDIPMPSLGEMENNHGDNDDELIVAATKKSLKCPLTTTWLVEPMTSKSCKHTFSKDAIFGMIKRSNGQIVECPVPGCRQALGMTSFYEDTLMERLVTKAKHNQGSENGSSQFHDV
ncbi:zinc-finger of the MIZ type in Nse subunit-domain-containing protein, partial [Halteromyces radiatus]|uniref:zinc-finger of the MIZ type in Nse subunit-domain-containing protein n=1 Tax=Halteromyces radiatus TaxID=101107 RepID=UPI0022209DA0